MISSFEGAPFRTFRFAKSVKISTYLYCICAGPYACFEPIGSNVDDQIPMRLYCRQSLKKFVKDIAQDWFRVTKNGIHFYEKFFSTKYPFDKFD